MIKNSINYKINCFYKDLEGTAIMSHTIIMIVEITRLILS